MTDASKAVLRAVIFALEAAERKGLRMAEGMELRVELVPREGTIRTTIRDPSHQLDLDFDKRSMEDTQLGVRL